MVGLGGSGGRSRKRPLPMVRLAVWVGLHSRSVWVGLGVWVWVGLEVWVWVSGCVWRSGGVWWVWMCECLGLAGLVTWVGFAGLGVWVGLGV